MTMNDKRHVRVVGRELGVQRRQVLALGLARATVELIEREQNGADAKEHLRHEAHASAAFE